MGLLICVAVNEHNNRNKSACSCGSQSLLIGYPQSTCFRQDTGKLKDNNSHTIVYKMCICTWGFMIYLHICLNVMCVCVSFCVCVCMCWCCGILTLSLAVAMEAPPPGAPLLSDLGPCLLGGSLDGTLIFLLSKHKKNKLLFHAILQHTKNSSKHTTHKQIPESFTHSNKYQQHPIQNPLEVTCTIGVMRGQPTHFKVYREQRKQHSTSEAKPGDFACAEYIPK